MPRVNFLVMIFSLCTISISSQTSISYTTPKENAINVNKTTSIEIKFDSPLDMSTVNDNTFIVSASTSGLHRGVFNYYDQNYILEFVPDFEFALNEVVTLYL